MINYHIADVAKSWFNCITFQSQASMYACSHGHFKVSFDTDDFERLFFHFLRESPNLLSYLDFQNKCLVDFFEELFIIWPMQRKEHYS